MLIVVKSTESQRMNIRWVTERFLSPVGVFAHSSYYQKEKEEEKKRRIKTFKKL